LGSIPAKICSLTLVVLGVAVATPAHAALDETLAVTARDVRVVAIAGKKLFVRSRDGVDEIADGTGRVFAFRWRRRLAPPLRALLGPYLAEYEAGLRARHRTGHAISTVRTRVLEAHVLARPRLSRGSVCLTARLPKGVTLDALP